MATAPPRKIMANEFAAALCAAGVIADDLGTISRIVIDAEAGEPVKLYIQKYGDERLLDVVPTLDGVEVRTGG